MDEKVIAVVKLAPGEVGFYDELTKIHLTITSPFAKIYDYMNTTAVQRAIRFNRLTLVTGSLYRGNLNNEAPKINMATSKIEATPVVEPAVKAATPEAIEIPVTEETSSVEEVISADEEAVTIEDSTEEVVEEKVQSKKKATKKKKED